MQILDAIHLLSGPRFPFRRRGVGVPVVPIIALMALAAWALTVGLGWLVWWAI